MFHLESIDYSLVDEFLVKEFTQNPPLPEVVAGFKRISYFLEGVPALDKVLRGMSIGSQLWSVCRLYKSDPKGALIALVTLIADCGVGLKSMSRRDILGKVWDALTTCLGGVKWSLLWNPWFVGGVVAIAGVIWLVHKKWHSGSG